MRTRRLPAALAAVLVLAGCSDGTAPAPIDGAFVLRSIGGQQLPVLVSEVRGTHPGTGTPGTRRTWYEGMRLVVMRADTDTLHWVLRESWDLDTGTDPGPSTLAFGQTVLVRNDTLCAEVTDAYSYYNLADDCSRGVRLVRRGAGLVMSRAPGPWPAIGAAEYVFEREVP